MIEDSGRLLKNLTKYYKGDRQPGYLEGSKVFNDLAERYLELDEEEKDLKREKAQAKKKIVDYLKANCPDSRRAIGDLISVNTYTTRTMDWKQFKVDYPNMDYDSYYKEGAETWAH